MELMLSLVAVLGVSGLLIWIGDKTSQDKLNKIGVALMIIGPLVAFMVFNDGGGGLEPADFYRP